MFKAAEIINIGAACSRASNDSRYTYRIENPLAIMIYAAVQPDMSCANVSKLGIGSNIKW